MSIELKKCYKKIMRDLLSLYLRHSLLIFASACAGNKNRVISRCSSALTVLLFMTRYGEITRSFRDNSRLASFRCQVYSLVV